MITDTVTRFGDNYYAYFTCNLEGRYVTVQRHYYYTLPNPYSLYWAPTLSTLAISEITFYAYLNQSLSQLSTTMYPNEFDSSPCTHYVDDQFNLIASSISTKHFGKINTVHILLDQLFVVLACYQSVKDGFDRLFQATVHFSQTSAVN